MKESVIAVTGAGGFLGSNIVNEIKQAHVAGVLPVSRLILIDTRPMLFFDEAFPFPIEVHVFDIREYLLLEDSLKGVDLVMHVASLVDWKTAGKHTLHDVNINGTDNVIRACRNNGVHKLIYTSTMDVVLGADPITDANENLPYPPAFHDAYAETKAIAEKLVVENNDASLSTAVIRPCAIYGPADPYYVTRTLELVKAGKLRARIGDGSARFQFTYVGNAAHAHCLLAKALLRNNAQVSGQIYIITDEPAENLFDFMEPIVRKLGMSYPRKEQYVSYSFAYMMAFIFETLILLFGPIQHYSSLTRDNVKAVCQDLSFDTRKALRHFQYKPKYSRQHAVEETVSYFKDKV